MPPRSCACFPASLSPEVGPTRPPSAAPSHFTTKGVYDEAHAHLSFIQGGGHGGSHPHLGHEFVSSIVEKRPSFPDVYQSVNWTCAGICAHESAMCGGATVKLPEFA